MAQLHRWTLVLFWLLSQVVPNSAYGDHHFAHDTSNKKKEMGRLEAGGIRAGIVTEEEAIREESGGYPGHAKRKSYDDEQEASAGESPHYDPNLAPQVNERFNAENLAGQIHEDMNDDREKREEEGAGEDSEAQAHARDMGFDSDMREWASQWKRPKETDWGSDLTNEEKEELTAKKVRGEAVPPQELHTAEL